MLYIINIKGFLIENGHWCPTCKKLSINDAHILAQNKNGIYLSVKYELAHKKLKCKCINNHIWSATIASIKYNKTWCPYCSPTNKRKYNV